MIWEFGKKIDIQGPYDLAIGAFDALHEGHQLLIAHLQGPQSMITLFEPLPAQVFQPNFPGSVYSFRQRCELIEELGVAHILRIDFSQEFSKMLGSDFLSELQSSFPLRKIVVGEDFCMGRGRSFCASQLQAWGLAEGVEVVIIPHHSYEQQDKLSATHVREAILSADFTKAQALLGRPYSLDLVDFPASESLGQVQVNLSESHQVFPPDGEYETQLGHASLRSRLLTMPGFAKECIFKNKVK